MPESISSTSTLASDWDARSSAVRAAAQLEIAASHWRSRPINCELNPSSLDQMTPYQFYFITGAKPKAVWPRNQTPYHNHIRLG
jgi:hypothetical protein